MKKDNGAFRIISKCVDENISGCSENEVNSLMDQLESYRVNSFIGDQPESAAEAEAETETVETAVTAAAETKPRRKRKTETASRKRKAKEIKATADIPKRTRKRKQVEVASEPAGPYSPGEVVEIQMYGMWWAATVTKLKLPNVVVKCADGQKATVTLSEIRHPRKTRKAS